MCEEKALKLCIHSHCVGTRFEMVELFEGVSIRVVDSARHIIVGIIETEFEEKVNLCSEMN